MSPENLSDGDGSSNERGAAVRSGRRLMRSLLAPLVVALLTATPGLARDDEQALAAEPAVSSRPEVIHGVPRAASEIAIDGQLDEPAWQSALSLSLDYETRPGENIAPPVKTEALVTYDSDHVYVAIRAHDPDPKAIRANLLDRDSAWDNDFAGVVLDTFNDERRAFEFFVNPLGVQMDLFMDDVGGNETSSWDAIWDSAGRITDSGYEVEMAIPYHQLRFPRAGGNQVWGIDVVRFYPRDQRHRIALQPMDRDLNCYLCQISKMEGFEGASPGKNLEIVPTITSRRADMRQDFPTGDFNDGGVETDPGITVKWGMTPNLTLSGTVNPDFSQVEADVAQLDINNQFALFFPERRPFFLEGADFFDTPLNVVFTRNVADPDWGLKLTGKEGKNAIGVFAAQDSLTNLLFPGSQRSRGDSLTLESTASVLRYRRDFGESSALGVLFTGREGGDYSNVVGGIDGLYRITDSDSVRFQYLSSQTEYPAEVAADNDQRLGSFSDDAYVLNYRHSDREWFWRGYYEKVGEDFRADMGFMPRVGYELLLGGLGRNWYPDEEKETWWTRIEIASDWDLTTDSAGNVLERELEVWTEIQGPKQSYFWFDVGNRDRFFNGVVFNDQSFVNTYFEFQPVGGFYFGMFANVGDSIDFANTRAADSITLEPSFRLDIGKRLRTRFEHTYRKLDVAGGELFTANLSQLRAVYQFNVRSFVRAIVQYRDISRNASLYEDEVDPKSESVFTQLLYSYKVNPQTVLFVGYTDRRLADQDISLTQSDRALFFKVGYAWNL